MTTETNGGWIEEIPQVEIEKLANGNIRLTDKSDLDQEYSVDVHPIQVRLLAERLGLLSQQAVPFNVALLQEQAKQQQQKVDRLQRDLLRLRGHALAVQKALREADWEHADLTFEMMAANALIDLFDMAVEDFEDDFEQDDGKLAPGVLWEGSNGGRQRDGAKRAQQTQREPSGNPLATQQEPAGLSGETSGQTYEWALRQPLDKSSTKFVLVAMAWKAGGIGRCCASTADLAEMTGQDRKTVLENIKRLSEIGLIVDTGEKGGPNKSIPIFQLTTDKEYEPAKTGQLPFDEAPS